MGENFRLDEAEASLTEKLNTAHHVFCFLSYFSGSSHMDLGSPIQKFCPRLYSEKKQALGGPHSHESMGQQRQNV